MMLYGNREKRTLLTKSNLRGVCSRCPAPFPSALVCFICATVGGVVPGPMGMPVPAIVHGGEEVLTPAQRSGISSPSINVYVTGNNIASDYDIDRIGEMMVDRIRLRTGLKI